MTESGAWTLKFVQMQLLSSPHSERDSNLHGKAGSSISGAVSIFGATISRRHIVKSKWSRIIRMSFQRWHDFIKV